MHDTSFSDHILRFFSESSNPVLFAGAGVSARAGVPVWRSYLTKLAEHIRSSDPLTSTQMLDAISDDDYLSAASYYFLVRKVRLADLLRNLATPLEEFDIAPIACLGGLPFCAYVTTNFDKVLPDLYSFTHRRAPTCFDLGDPALASAAFRDEFFVARIHGKVEAPETMVLSKEHYSRLPLQQGYLAILRHILSYKQVLFLGFSFLDPAIRKVLDLINSRK